MTDEDKRWLNEQMAKVAIALFGPPTEAELLEREAIFKAGIEMFENPQPHWWARRSMY